MSFYLYPHPHPLTSTSLWCGPAVRAGLEIPGGGRRADPALCHPATRGDPGIRALLVQAGSLETDWGWHRDSSGRHLIYKMQWWGGKKKGEYEGEEEEDCLKEGWEGVNSLTSIAVKENIYMQSHFHLYVAYYLNSLFPSSLWQKVQLMLIWPVIWHCMSCI